MELLNKVKERLDITDDKQNQKIQGYIDDITSKIKSICKRTDFPQQLNYICIDYAIKNYTYYKDKDNSNNEQLQVTSASDHGQSVNFKTVETVTKDDIDLDKIIDKNIAEISNYAYMEWRT